MQSIHVNSQTSVRSRKGFVRSPVSKSFSCLLFCAVSLSFNNFAAANCHVGSLTPSSSPDQIPMAAAHYVNCNAHMGKEICRSQQKLVQKRGPFAHCPSAASTAKTSLAPAFAAKIDLGHVSTLRSSGEKQGTLSRLNSRLPVVNGLLHVFLWHTIEESPGSATSK